MRRRRPTADDLAQVYGAVARARPEFVAAQPAVVLIGVSLDSSATQRLHHLGVDVLAIEDAGPQPGAYLLGGAMHGTRVPAGMESAGMKSAGTESAGMEYDFAAEVLAQVERGRLREWAAETGPEPTFSTMHKPGSDSRGVVQFRLAGREIVAKIGTRDAIASEVRFASTVNDQLATQGRRGLFPEVLGLRIEGDQAVSLMEAGEPMPIGPLFADPARTTLADDALPLLEPHLDQLAAWYRLTVDTRRPTAVDYLYRERYHVLLRTPAFVDTFRSFFGDLPMDDLLDAPVELPGGLIVAGYREAVAWLDEVAPQLLPDYGSAVHGDIYAANMLLREDRSPMLIDPRTVWEGRDRPDVGYGDPVFDLATLLHGVLPMAAILRAAETDTAGDLFAGEIRPDQAKLDLSSMRLPVAFPPAVRSLETRMLAALPRADETARIRLYIGTATSLAGWLKYANKLGSPHAWLATYAFVAWYLWRARSLWGKAS